MKSLVILSGGMDSAVCLASAVKLYDNVETITFDYGQKHDREIVRAKLLSKHYAVKNHLIELKDLTKHFRTSLGKDSELEIPSTTSNEIPSSYVPMRNTIMLSIAVGIAESNDIDFVIYGANAIDYSGYPDCRPDYVSAYNSLLDKAVAGKQIKIKTPIIDLKKSEVVQLGNSLNVPFELTWSCYRGRELSCGKCASCEYRLKGFKEANEKDPLEYEI
jgi:7-cyano-7-deazaguanine synthase